MPACSFKLTGDEGWRLPGDSREAFCFGWIHTVLLNYIYILYMTHSPICVCDFIYSWGCVFMRVCLHPLCVSVPSHGCTRVWIRGEMMMMMMMMINVDLCRDVNCPFSSRLIKLKLSKATMGQLNPSVCFHHLVRAQLTLRALKTHICHSQPWW